MINLTVLTPETICYQGEVVSVELPGMMGRFTVLKGHAPLLTALQRGEIIYKTADGTANSIALLNGFVEIADNRVMACIEMEGGIKQ